MKENEIENYWNEDHLIKAKKEDLDSINISEESKIFLSNTGLPKQFGLLLEFDLTLELLGGGYRIGSDGNIEVCIDGINNSIVQTFDKDGELPPTFINSNVICLVKCLIEYKRILIDNEEFDYSDEESELLARSLEKEIAFIDNKALKHEGNWWSLVIEQIEQGLI